jgi:hypothetical protein
MFDMPGLESKEFVCDVTARGRGHLKAKVIY